MRTHVRPTIVCLLAAVLAAPAPAHLRICGDIDSTLSINVLDALAAAQVAVGLAMLNPPQFCRADVNDSGDVNITDALLISQFSVAILATLDCSGCDSSDCDTQGAAILDFQTTDVMLVVTNTAVLDGNLTVDVGITHTYRGDLRVTLIHPGGAAVTLHDRSGGGADDIIGTYPTTLVPSQSLSLLDGLPANGTWTLRVADLAGADIGTIDSWCIHVDSSPLTVTNIPYSRVASSVTGNNLIPYAYARLTGGGLPENVVQFSAEEWSAGPNRVPEDGGGDDVYLGPLSGGSWATPMPPNQGTIDALTGLFTAGDVSMPGTVGSFVTYSHPTAGNSQLRIAVIPPDWRP